VDILHDNLESAMVNKLKADKVAEKGSLAFTTDGWSSKSMVPFQSLTLHYLDDDFNLVHMMLDCQRVKGSHTAAFLAKVKKYCLNCYF